MGNALVVEEEDPQLFSAPNPELGGCGWANNDEGLGVDMERGSRGAGAEAEAATEEALDWERKSESSSNVTHCCLRVSRTGAGAGARTGARTGVRTGARAGAGTKAGAGMGVSGAMGVSEGGCCC